MKKQILYNYLGTNGSILSPIHLEGIYFVKKIRITADENKQITKDNKNFYFSMIVPEDEVDDWYEVPIEGQN